MDNYNNSLNIGGGGNSDYNIIRTPSKVEFDNLVINSDLNGTLNSDFNTRKINAWNYYDFNFVTMDNAAFQDNINNTSMRCEWTRQSGQTYTNHDKDFYTTNFGYNHILIANFRPIIVIEYRE